MAVTSLRPGQPEVSLSAITALTDTKGIAFAVPVNQKESGRGRVVTWNFYFAGSPTVVEVRLEGALNDVDAEYMTLDVSTNVLGEIRTVAPVNVRFTRIRQISRTGGTSITANLQVT